MKSCLVRNSDGEQIAFKFSTEKRFFNMMDKLHQQETLTFEQTESYEEWFEAGYRNVTIDGNIHFEITEL